MFIESQIANVGRATNGRPVNRGWRPCITDVINLINTLRENMLFCAQWTRSFELESVLDQ
jgi:hypothetical protein